MKDQYLSLNVTVTPLSEFNEIENVFDEALELATRLNLTVTFETAGIKCFCSPKGDKKRLIKSFTNAYNDSSIPQIAF